MGAPNTFRASDIPAEINNFYERVLLMRAVPLFVHGLFAQVRNITPQGVGYPTPPSSGGYNIPGGSGTKIIKFRRYSNLTAATTALTEGTTPTGQSLAVTDITATCAQYGDWTKISDQVTIESVDPVLTEAAQIFGDQMGDTNDQLTRDIIVAGSVIKYCSPRVSRVTVAAGDIINLIDVKTNVKTLKLANARKLTSISNVSGGIGTLPINAAYVGITHPSITYTLKGLTGWTGIATYNPNVVALPGEQGSLDEVRFVETTNAKIFTGAGAGGIDVYATMFLGAQAYGTVDLNASQNAALIYKALGSAGVADPLNQLQSLGWKEYFVAKILNDNFMVRYECAYV
jgi:N4-gp56 family major capsid protein